MWLLLTLATAFFTSLNDVLSRKAVGKIDKYIIAWAWLAFTLPFLYPFVLARGVPALGPQFVPALLTSTLILTVSAVYYVKAIKVSDLSISVPMLTFTPVFLLVTSRLMLGESPGLMGLAGILLIVVGSYVLNFKDRVHGYLAPFKSLVKEKGPRYMLIVALLYSIGANVDKIGVQNSSPLMWTFALNASVTVALSLLMLKKSDDIRKQIKSVWPLLLLMGFCGAMAMFLQMIAIQMVIVPYLIAVKRTSVFMTSLFGFWLFKEKGIHERSLGAFLMVLGVLIIAFCQ